MTKESLIKLKEKIAKLNETETKLRNQHLRKLANGELQGPPVGYASIDKSWLKYYSEKQLNDASVPKMSIYQYMLECTKDKKKLVGEEYFGFKISNKKIHKNIIKVAKSLYEMGVRPGDKVSVCLPNIPEEVYIFYAINYLGAIINTQDPRISKEVLVDQVNTAESDIVITLDQFASNFIESDAKKIVTMSAVNSLPGMLQMVIKKFDKTLDAKLPNNDKVITYKEFINKGKNISKLPEPYYKENTPAVIAYTGGTTGDPKGALATNEAINSMALEDSMAGFNIEPGDRWLNMAPPWTYYGLSNSLNCYLCNNITGILIPTFGPDDLGKLIKKYRPNGVVTVPSALVAFMNDIEENYDLSFIKEVVVGADKLDPTFEQRFNKFLADHNSKAKVSKGYGMTEATAAATYTVPGTNLPDSVGIPFALGNIGIFDPDDPDKELSYGEVGEIAFQGPKNMIGYFGDNEEKTKEILKQHSDGTYWIHSQDAGYIDKEGHLYVNGRYKRMFTKGGFKIFPGTIEKEIMNVEDINQCAVIAVESELTGNNIKAFVTLSENSLKDESEIREEVLETLSKKIYEYEMPDEIEFIDKMPLTGMNKINDRELENRENTKIQVKK